MAGSRLFQLVFFGLWIVPAFLLINTREPFLVYFSIIVAPRFIYPAIYASLAAFRSELFDTRVRYMGVGSVYQFSGIFASVLTPTIATALLAIAGGTPWLFVGYVVAVTFVSLASVYVLPEMYRKDITPMAEAQTQETEPVREG